MTVTRHTIKVSGNYSETICFHSVVIYCSSHCTVTAALKITTNYPPHQRQLHFNITYDPSHFLSYFLRRPSGPEKNLLSPLVLLIPFFLATPPLRPRSRLPRILNPFLFRANVTQPVHLMRHRPSGTYLTLELEGGSSAALDDAEWLVLVVPAGKEGDVEETHLC